MSKEIELPSDLVDALNKYIDAWSKTYPILKDVNGDTFYFVLEGLGYLPRWFYEHDWAAEYEIGECDVVLWDVGPSAANDIRQRPEVEVGYQFGGGEEPPAVLLVPGRGMVLTFLITDRYYVTSERAEFWFYEVVPMRGKLEIWGDFRYGEEERPARLEYIIEGARLKFIRAVDTEKEQVQSLGRWQGSIELPAWMRRLGISATKLFLSDEKDDLIRALNCAADLLNKVYQPTLIYLLY
jgi:hypothetical protein